MGQALTITTADKRTAWIDLKALYNINADDRHLTLIVDILTAVIPATAAAFRLLWSPDDGTTIYEIQYGQDTVKADIPSTVVKAGLSTVFDTHAVLATTRRGGSHAIEFITSAGAVVTPGADTAIELSASLV